MMGVTVCGIILHSGCLGPGLVTARNEVTYGKWIPDFFASLFTIPLGCLHTAARHSHWSAPPLPLVILLIGHFSQCNDEFYFAV